MGNFGYLCLETLANKLRFNTLLELEKGQKSVNELAEKLKVEQSRLSHALGILKKCSFIKSKKQGRHEIYSIHHPFLFNKLKNKSILDAAEDYRIKYCKNKCRKL